MVKNVKIKAFLIFSFVIVLFLMIVLGGSSLFFNGRLANQTITFYESPHTVQVQMTEIEEIMANIGSQIKEALIYQTPEKTQETTKILDQYFEKMNTKIASVKERFLGDKTLLTNADGFVEKWLAANSKIKDAMEREIYDEAIRVFETEYLPVEQQLREAVTKISESSAQDSEAFYISAQRSKAISRYAILGIVFGTIILTFLICSTIIRSITVPLRQIKKAADALAQGNLSIEIPFEGKNEFGQLAESMRKTMKTLSVYVNNIDNTLERMAENDMTVKIDIDYIGDFAPIKKSMKKIVSSLNATILQIEQCSEQVSGGSEQVAGSSQVLSQGASEQAASVEELSSSASQITEQVKQNASFTTQAHEIVDSVGAELMYGNEQMNQMLSAISEINATSSQIAKIIKTIEDIAFQTNILALNAAVEAARAGAAGKGFAVVADEVRNLAGKSAEAAKNTTELIQNSIHAVEHGTAIANDTAATLGNVVTRAQDITDMVAKIASSSQDQAISISQITSGIEQISQVVQANSATAEECAASSEELSSQAQTLKILVDRFQLQK